MFDQPIGYLIATLLAWIAGWLPTVWQKVRKLAPLISTLDVTITKLLADYENTKQRADAAHARLDAHDQRITALEKRPA
jgi:outer membrane murein-binding lipoprotein Lpp